MKTRSQYCATMSTRALQQQRALHLYRHSLKTILYWAVRRELWFTEVKDSQSTDDIKFEELL